MIEIDVGDPLPAPRRHLKLIYPQGVFAGSARGSSYYSRLLRCPREHALTHLAKLQPIRDNEALTVGSLFHLVLEVYYNSLQPLTYPYTSEQRFAAEQRAMNLLNTLADEPGYADTFATVSRISRAYFDEYRDHDQWEVLAAEISAEVSTPIVYSARLDLLVRDHSKAGHALLIVEHKTCRAITPDLVSGYQLSLQIMGQAYLWGKVLRQEFPKERFDGILINLTSKHATPRFLRIPVFPSQDHLDVFEFAVTSYGHLEVAYAALGYPPDFTKCSGAPRGYTTCQFYEVCFSHPKLDVEFPPPGFLVVGQVEEPGKE